MKYDTSKELKELAMRACNGDRRQAAQWLERQKINGKAEDARKEAVKELYAAALAKDRRDEASGK